MQHSPQSPGNRQFVEKRQIFGAQERRRSVERRGKARGGEPAGASSRLDESQFLKPADFAVDAETLVEINEVGATAKKNVLAVVHDFAGSRMLVGRCATAKVGTPLEQGDLESDIGQSAARSQTGKAASNHGYGLPGSWLHAIRSRKPRESTRSFSQRVRLTRLVIT